MNAQYSISSGIDGAVEAQVASLPLVLSGRENSARRGLAERMMVRGSRMVHGRRRRLGAFMAGHLNPAIRSPLIGLTLSGRGVPTGRLGTGINVGGRTRSGSERRRGDRSQ